MFFVLGVRACVIIGVAGFGNQGFCFEFRDKGWRSGRSP